MWADVRGTGAGEPGRMTRAIRRALVALALAATAVPAAATPVAATETLTWRECPGGGGPDGMECADLRVPLDPARPDGRQLTLVLGRLRADGGHPAEGTVLVNYGGPGAPNVEMMRDRSLSPGTQPFASLRHHMDIVTWDTRGFPGLSTPALDFSCLSGLPANPDPLALPTDEAGFRRLAARNRDAADACRTRDPELFDRMDAAANARDMEAVRRALGVPRMSLYMGSYGGVYGQTYARLYPERVRGMVLDGTPNHTDPYPAELVAQARENGRRMDRFAAWCATDTGCALHGRDVPAVWRALTARADRTPVPAPDVHASFGGWTLRMLGAERLHAAGPADWPALARDIAHAVDGDASGLAESPTHPYPSMSYPVSHCREWPRAKNFADLRSTVDGLARVDPNFGAGGTFAASMLACVGWPVGVDDPVRALPRDLPPLLAVGSWGDSAMTARAVDRVPGSGTVTHDGPGHELYATGNACVVAHADRYLTTGAVPPPGTAC
ncbi:alpha/beta hydrolase [Actinocatenispora rupis]